MLLLSSVSHEITRNDLIQQGLEQGKINDSKEDICNVTQIFLFQINAVLFNFLYHGFQQKY